LLIVAERLHWRVRRADETSRMSGLVDIIKSHPLTRRVAIVLVALAVPLFLIGGSLSVRTVPGDFGVLSVITLLILLIHLFFGNGSTSIAGRAPVYIAAMFIAYLTVEYPPLDFADVRAGTDLVFFTVLALAVAIAVRVGKDRGFEVTPTDYLIVFVVLSAGLIAKHFFDESDVSALLLKGVIVLYACELLIQGAKRRWNSLSLSSLAALGVLGARGLLF
jgi:UDP-GlcNAc:undecaprenyl-phosphate GlcNAc-1-phosphate transferase